MVSRPVTPVTRNKSHFRADWNGVLEDSDDKQRWRWSTTRGSMRGCNAFPWCRLQQLAREYLHGQLCICSMSTPDTAKSWSASPLFLQRERQALQFGPAWWRRHPPRSQRWGDPCWCPCTQGPRCQPQEGGLTYWAGQPLEPPHLFPHSFS